MFIDSHAHLEGHRFDDDRAAVLTRAHAAGVDAVLLIGSGTGPGSLDCAIQLVDQFSGKPDMPELFATIGIHPHEAKLANDPDFAEMDALAKHPRVIAWGEIGLDYFYDHSPRDLQQKVFLRQMEQAEKVRMPIVIHCRPSDNSWNAWDDTLETLRRHWSATGLGGILHCFTGTVEHMHAAVELGFMISFAGNVTFPKAENIRDAARHTPLDRILIETDSPFLAPIPYRGKRNEPAYVVNTAAKVAEIRGTSVDAIAVTTTHNFDRFFSLSDKFGKFQASKTL